MHNDDGYWGIENNTLIEDIFEQKRLQTEIKDRIQRMEHVLISRMEEEGAAAIPHSRFRVERVLDGWDDNKLQPLYELMSSRDVAKAILPASERVVTTPERWNGSVLRTFMKFGSEIRNTIEGAKTWKRQIKITELE